MGSYSFDISQHIEALQDALLSLESMKSTLIGIDQTTEKLDCLLTIQKSKNLEKCKKMFRDLTSMSKMLDPTQMQLVDNAKVQFANINKTLNEEIHQLVDRLKDIKLPKKQDLSQEDVVAKLKDDFQKLKKMNAILNKGNILQQAIQAKMLQIDAFADENDITLESVYQESLTEALAKMRERMRIEEEAKAKTLPLPPVTQVGFVSNRAVLEEYSQKRIKAREAAEERGREKEKVRKAATTAPADIKVYEEQRTKKITDGRNQHPKPHTKKKS